MWTKLSDRFAECTDRKRLAKSKKEKEKKEILETFCKVEVNVSLLDVIKQVTKYVKFLKELCTKKNKLSENEKVMCDLGVSIKVMPLSIYNSLNDGPLKKTSVVIQLADRYIIYPDGVLEDELVQVDGDVTNGDSIDVLDTLSQNAFELSHDDKLNIVLYRTPATGSLEG
ncbi:uncharacterized protein LOC110625629 [Manihot esculenta]|uniref:uncharacterized protein LOC110625629 n=1 Tax=Manihot esculenta TaxID=3983 RepID=UPI000B5D27A3|nr:uncharacterized protein LOC110625629 [Manihot esculenta]